MTGPLPAVALRADAARRIGLGHVKRCIALGQALQDLGCRTAIVTRAADLDVMPIVRAAGLDTIVLPVAGRGDGHSTEQGDALDTARALQSFAPDRVVVDSYTLGRQWHVAVRERLGVPLGVIDDLADRPMEVDWVLNPNLESDASAYRRLVSNVRRVLCGPCYALLGREYAQVPAFRVDRDVGSIGIFMGGTDHANLSVRALQACREEAAFIGPIEVASTSDNPNLPELQHACARWPNTSLLLDAPELSAFFGRHGLQIGAGGGATWERCRVGAPSLLLLAAENQRAVVPGVVRLGAAACLEPLEASDRATIGQAVRTLLSDDRRRMRMSARARELVDGLGAERAALSLAARALTVRPARLPDAVMLHAWRNASVTREMSFDSREIAFEQHRDWFERALIDASRVLLIGQVGPRAVGAIRFDAQPDGWAEVSLYLDPVLHGLGLGSVLLAAGEDLASGRAPGVQGYVARVRDDNPRSARMFAAAGYVQRDGVWRKAGQRAAREELL